MSVCHHIHSHVAYALCLTGTLVSFNMNVSYQVFMLKIMHEFTKDHSHLSDSAVSLNFAKLQTHSLVSLLSKEKEVLTAQTTLCIRLPGL